MQVVQDYLTNVSSLDAEYRADVSHHQLYSCVLISRSHPESCMQAVPKLASVKLPCERFKRFIDIVYVSSSGLVFHKQGSYSKTRYFRIHIYP